MTERVKLTKEFFEGLHEHTWILDEDDITLLLDNQEKLDKITKFAKNLSYSNPHVSWQLKELLKDSPSNKTL